MRRLFFFQVAFEHSRDGERTIQSVICWSQRLKVDWEKAKGSFGQLYVSRQNASASIESIAYFKEIGQ